VLAVVVTRVLVVGDGFAVGAGHLAIELEDGNDLSV